MADPLCPEADYRASLSDGEFWDYVLNGHRPGDPVDDYDPDEDDNRPTDDELVISTPCPECGQVGACAYDAEGRPLIHAITDTDDEA